MAFNSENQMLNSLNKTLKNLIVDKDVIKIVDEFSVVSKDLIKLELSEQEFKNKLDSI